MHSIKIYVPCFEKFLFESIKSDELKKKKKERKGKGQEKKWNGFYLLLQCQTLYFAQMET